MRIIMTSYELSTIVVVMAIVMMMIVIIVVIKENVIVKAMEAATVILVFNTIDVDSSNCNIYDSNGACNSNTTNVNNNSNNNSNTDNDGNIDSGDKLDHEDLNVLILNVCGLVHRLKYEVFVEKLCKYKIICLCEIKADAVDCITIKKFANDHG